MSAFLIPDPVFVTIPYPGCRGQIGKKIRDRSGTIPSTIGPKKCKIMFNSVADQDPDPHVFGIPDPVPDPLVRVMDPNPDLDLDPDPYIIMQN